MRDGTEKQELTDQPCDPCTVLIFDEDLQALAQHAEPFEARGFEVHKCMAVESAMRCIEREDLNVALVDQVSPAFEGRRVIRHLIRYNARTPFIVIAACRDMLCERQALALGALEYWQKPVPGRQIRELIDKLFGERSPADSSARHPGRIPGFANPAYASPGSTRLAPNTTLETKRAAEGQQEPWRTGG